MSEKEDHAVQQAQQLHEASVQIDRAIRSFQEHPERLADLLAYKGRFYEETINNVILIAAQKPDASCVMDVREWIENGYTVKEGEKGILVLKRLTASYLQGIDAFGRPFSKPLRLATLDERERIKSGEYQIVKRSRYGMLPIFDITQTTCPKKAYPEFRLYFSQADHENLVSAVSNYCHAVGIQIIKGNVSAISDRSYYNSSDNSIHVSERLGGSYLLAALSRELCRAATANCGLSPAGRELEAAALEILLQARFGFALTVEQRRRFRNCYYACMHLSPRYRLKDILRDVNDLFFDLSSAMAPYLGKVEHKRTRSSEQVELPDERDSFSVSVEMAMTGKYSAPQPVLIGDTAPPLQLAGLPNLPLYIAAGHISSMIHAESPENIHWHGLDVNQVKMLPVLLRQPALILRSWRQADTLIAVLDAVDHKRAPLIVPIKSQACLADGRHCNLATSTYGRQRFITYDTRGLVGPRCFLSLALDNRSFLYVDPAKCCSLFEKMNFPMPDAETELGSLLRESYMPIQISAEETRNKTLSNRDFSGLDLSGTDFSGWRLSDCKFNQSNLSRAIFKDAVAYDCQFIFTNLRDADFYHAVLSQSIFSFSHFQNANLAHAEIQGGYFLGTNIDNANLAGAKVVSAFFDLVQGRVKNVDQAEFVLRGCTREESSAFRSRCLSKFAQAAKYPERIQAQLQSLLQTSTNKVQNGEYDQPLAYHQMKKSLYETRQTVHRETLAQRLQRAGEQARKEQQDLSMKPSRDKRKEL